MAADGLRVCWTDVFSERPFAGNPLAVVLDADELADVEMVTLTRELMLSETTFVLEENTRLRIFTPGGEVPLAGHPTVGAALELARLGRIPAEGVTVFATGAGETPVELRGGVATMTQSEPLLGQEIDAALAARLLGLEPGDVIGQPAVCNTAFEQGFAQVRNRELLARVRPDLAGIAALEPLALVAWCEEDPRTLAQRAFLPRLDIREDPATGAAAGAVSALRVFQGAEPGALTIHQGEEVGRPSTIQTEVSGEPGRPERVRVGGRAVPILEATLQPGLFG